MRVNQAPTRMDAPRTCFSRTYARHKDRDGAPAEKYNSAMNASKKKRKSASSVTVDTNVRCLRVYPTEDTKRTVAELQSVGIKLSKDQAIHLARVLLVVSQEWD